jgi:hypothetical protein
MRSIANQHWGEKEMETHVTGLLELLNSLSFSLRHGFLLSLPLLKREAIMSKEEMKRGGRSNLLRVLWFALGGVGSGFLLRRSLRGGLLRRL